MTTPIYATGEGWNPDVDAWAPSSDPLEPQPFAHQSHADDPNAEPISEQYGAPPSGTVPAPGMNLIDSVKQAMNTPGAPVVIRHEIINVEFGAEAVRFHQEVVASNQAPTVLLQENAQRKRALVKNISAATQYAPSLSSAGSNSQIVTTVPAGQTWTIASYLFGFTSDANVGNRQLQIIARDPLNRTIATYTMSVTQPASQNVQYQTMPGISTDFVQGGIHYFPNVFAGIPLTAGSTITVVNIGFIGAGDTFSTPAAELTGAFGTVYLMPARDGGTPAAPLIGWKLGPGDVLELKTLAAVEAVTGFAGDTATLTVYEEIVGTDAGKAGVSA